MAVEVLGTEGAWHFHCTTTDAHFGPTFGAWDVAEVEAFIDWLPLDPRQYTHDELAAKWSDWQTVTEGAHRD